VTVVITCLAAGWLWALTILLSLQATGLGSWHLGSQDLDWRSGVVFEVILLGWSACYFALRHWLEHQAARSDAQRLAELAREAQLNLLRYQLNPHFFLNALNSIRSEMPLELVTAREMITDLADYLRYALDPRRQDFVTLGEEIAGLEHYFAIERLRFGDRLQIEVAVEPAASAVSIPVFLLQPLVENAIKYGRQGNLNLTVGVRACLRDHRLKIEVANTGQWLPPKPGSRTGTGIGLQNVRARLAVAYPGDHTLDIEAVDGWVKVRLNLPASEDPADNLNHTDHTGLAGG
jgi:LytS/YehU family sensor histidine kinase